MKKVCHITTVHTSRYDVRIFEKECSSLAETGFDVTLIVNDMLNSEIKNNVSISSLNFMPKNRIHRALAGTKLAFEKAIEIDADIYHLHDPELLLIAKKLKNKGKKVIFDSHEFTALQILSKPYLPKILRTTISRMYSIIETKIINQIDGLVYPCTYNGSDYFKNINIPKVIIGNFPSMNCLITDSQVNEMEVEDSVCYVGTMSESRGLIYMIKAAAIAKKKLVLIGHISEVLLEKISNMEEFNSVEYLGKLPHEEAMKRASRCSVGLSLLQAEGQYAALDNLPTKLYEYMCMGLPSVFSAFPYYIKICNEKMFGIPVNPSDEKEIAKAIKQLTEDSQLRKQCSLNGLELVRDGMNWEQEALKLQNFYNII